MELHQMVARNRLKTALIIGAFSLLAVALSGLGVYAIHAALDISWDLWLALLLFWGAMIIFYVLRFVFGWKWMFRQIDVLLPGSVDIGLRDALDAARIAAGLEEEVRLLVIPNADVNSFSVALPDGSYAVMAARGVEKKLPYRAREAMMAHEIGHIQAGDTLLQTFYLCLVGRSAFPRQVSGRDPLGRRLIGSGSGMVFKVATVILLVSLVSLGSLAAYGTGMEIQLDQPWLPWAGLALLFVFLVFLLPLLMHPLFRLALDREREYSADLLAAYRTRDPLAVHQAIEGAALDVVDVMLVPSYLDALLFCPVVDYTSYKPFRTQPTMQERMRRLRECFPSLEIELQGRS